MGVNYFPDDSSFKEFLNLKVFDNPSIVQFIHRNLAYLIIIFYALILFKVINTGNKKLYKPISVIGLTLAFQIFLGVITILSGVKMLFASLHQINSILIILSTLYFLFISKYKRQID
jgi:cytochrome c oxidase assembly protein subunit 15